ncbi:SDR family oxidoreductase [Leucobacter allii]|uniref:SDR family NAD(P)-dependent oxidoreductase n=1 Tax=Leucobacter allii TaxID=2932247 RepID=UPI001FD01182|nr:SDR family NAD(P)-dependent oxidoreductase [Leucobacter allii]UOR01314.1 SDR family oxidoreductase [Leucobacter allii]
MTASAAGGSRTAVITGASGGMGVEAALRFASSGHRLALLDLSGPRLEEVAERVRSTHGDVDVLCVPCDVSDPASVAHAREAVSAWSGEVHALLLIAGVLQQAAPVTELSVEEWDRTQGVNIRGDFLMIREFAPIMPPHAGASIVAIASWYGRSGHALFSAYCASKAAVISLVQSVAAELAPLGIRANSVCPGNIDTEMHRTALREEAEERGITYEEMKAIEWAKIPLEIAGPPTSIIDAVAFLASEQAAYVTGASIDVNGGVLFH